MTRLFARIRAHFAERRRRKEYMRELGDYYAAWSRHMRVVNDMLEQERLQQADQA